MEKTDFSTIVIIADNIPIDKSKLTIYSREIDRAYQTNVAYLKNGFEEFFESVIVYDDPQDFMANAKSHKKDIIFPYWHGELSRNKHALIASVCEIEQLIYIGPDTYTNIVCSDKIISKDICRIADIKYPRFMISQEQNIPIKWDGIFPVVAKPIYEGSSLGITKDNLIDNNIDLQNIIDRLWIEFQQPILVEEFIGGTEVNLAIVGWKDNIKAWGATERYHVNDANYFDHGLFTFEEKNLKDDILLRDGRKLQGDLNFVVYLNQLLAQ